MRELLKITAGGLIVALAAGPVLAQTGTVPKQEQQAPRNQGGTTSSPPTVTAPDTSSSTQSQGTGTMSRDNPSGTGTMSGDTMRGHKAGKANVRQVQEALKSQGHDPGPIDGVMGPQTKEALRAYQRAQNLTETGQLDRQTMDKLGVGGGMGQRSQSR